MATVALGAIGNVVLPGVGQAIGAALGAVIDQYTWMQELQEEDVSASYGSVEAQGAEGGAVVWRAHGKQARVAANVLWVGNLNQVATSNRSGKRGEITTTTNYLDAAIGFSRHLPGNFSKIQRINVDGKLLYDGRPPLSKSVVISSGRNQSAASTLIPRVFLDFYSDPPWSPTLNGINYNERGISVIDEPVVQRVLAANGVALNWRQFGSVINSTNQVIVADMQVNVPAGHSIPVGRSAWASVVMTSTPANPESAAVAFQINEWCPWLLVYATSANDLSLRFAMPTVRRNFTVGSVDISAETFDLAIYGGLRCARDSAVDEFSAADASFDIIRSGGVIWWTSDRATAQDRYVNDINFLTLKASDAAAFVPSTLPMGGWFQSDTPLDEVVTLRQNRRLWNTDIIEGGANDVEFTYETTRAAGGEGTSDQQQSQRLLGKVGENVVPGFRDMAVAVLENINVSATSNRLGNFDGIVECLDTSVSDVVLSVCEFHGLDPDDCDVSAVAGDCGGYAYSGVSTGVDALAPLITAYDLAPQESGRGIVWHRYSTAPVISVPEDAWLADGDGNTLDVTELDDQKKVRTITLTYRSEEEDLIWKQRVDVNPSAVGGSDEAVRVNIALTEDQAFEIVQRIGRRVRAARWKASGRLPRTYQNVQEGDVISTVRNGIALTFRVQRAEVDTDGSTRIEGIREVR